jgi:hypothetical protein
LNYAISGNVLITITKEAGANAVLSGLFFDPTAAGAASATFLEQDTTTQGNWIGVYGTDGYDIVANPSTTNPNDLPAGVTVTPAGESSYTWTSPNPTGAKQALEVPPSGTTRIAACWYSATSFTVDVNVASGSYNLELYFLDYNGSNERSEQIQFREGSTGAVLSTQTVSSFSNGAYMDYTISGNVLITITKETGANAVLSGLFFDPAPPAGGGPENNGEFAMGGALPKSGENTSVPAYDALNLSNPNAARDSSSPAASVPQIVKRIDRGSSTGATINPAGARVDLMLGTLPADANVRSLTPDTSIHDLALEQVSEFEWGRLMSRRNGVVVATDCSG